MLLDEIVPEPAGGAHTDHARAAELLNGVLERHFGELKRQTVSQLLTSRYEKFRRMAQFFTGE